mgnify:CR=1 FL=1
MTASLPHLTAPALAESTRPRREAVAAAAREACSRIAPLWPLKHFVASNPYLGVLDRPLVEAQRLLSHTGGGRVAMPRAFYAEQLRTGRMLDRHVTAALELVRARTRNLEWAQRALPSRADQLRERVRATLAHDAVEPQLLPTVASVLTARGDTDWDAFVVERISQWAGAYFDAGQASWRSPWRDLPPYGAWRAESSLDRSAELAGIPGFRRVVRSLPGVADEAVMACVARLGLRTASLAPYFHRLLMTIPGWAGYARYLEWEGARFGDGDESLLDLLAVRMAWEVALLDGSGDRGLHAAWAAARDVMEAAQGEDASAHDVELLTDHVLHEAFELAWQEGFVRQFTPRAMDDSAGAITAAPAASRPAVQAVFCIDVRSEPYRRALESVSRGTATLGFAGFFGVPLSYQPLGEEHGSARCPVLLAPTCTVTEVVANAPRVATDLAAAHVAATRREARGWRAFARGAVSSFGYVEAMGLGQLVPLVRDAFGLRRSKAPTDGGSRRPILTPQAGAHGATGIEPAHRAQLAEGILKGMSLRDGFARLVVLVGHGATSENNPHATGLDCGACGGHAGDANARVAAALLNDADVRIALLDRGIRIPRDTHFLPALHDTTTDHVRVYDVDRAPATHAADIEALRTSLEEASRRCRRARAASLGVAADGATPEEVTRAVEARSRDWSQVRPEWGLAGCASFIAAPRHRTASLDLGGRAFLHSYDWTQDDGFGVLELIMTAPMVVASWINLQYFGSTTDPQLFGSGNKVLHNVVGTLGVVEGNGGDLRSGLPMQSLHDGERLVHEPLRLNVVIEAPIEAMTAIIERHASVRTLVDHRWIHLWAMDDRGVIAWRYAGGGAWHQVLAGMPVTT